MCMNHKDSRRFLVEHRPLPWRVGVFRSPRGPLSSKSLRLKGSGRKPQLSLGAPNFTLKQIVVKLWSRWPYQCQNGQQPKSNTGWKVLTIRVVRVSASFLRARIVKCAGVVVGVCVWCVCGCECAFAYVYVCMFFHLLTPICCLFKK
jgi:hypothetical protein